jgi:site-specific recombinase XerC
MESRPGATRELHRRVRGRGLISTFASRPVRTSAVREREAFLGHEKLETTQIYASSSPRMIQDSYRRALGSSS